MIKMLIKDRKHEHKTVGGRKRSGSATCAWPSGSWIKVIIRDRRRRRKGD